MRCVKRYGGSSIDHPPSLSEWRSSLARGVLKGASDVCVDLVSKGDPL